MTALEIQEKINSNGGEWKSNHEIIFTIEGDETIYANRDKFKFFLIKHSFKDMDFHLFNAGELSNMNNLFKFALDLIADLNLDFRLETGKITTKIVEKQDEKILGEIEAYEKILLGKKITIE